MLKGICFLPKITRWNLLQKSKSVAKIIRKAISTIAKKSWKGAAAGAVAAMFIYLIIMGSYVKTGISPLVDLLLIIIMIGSVIFGIGFLGKWLFIVVRQFPPLFIGAFFASFIAAQFLPGNIFSVPFIAFWLVSGAIIGYAVSKGGSRFLSGSLIVFVAAVNIFIGWSLFSEGSESEIEMSEFYLEQKSPLKNIEDPSLPGSFQIKELYYGSGNDRHRPEYAENVEFQTESVDATPFFDQSSGFQNTLRKIYWGFNSKNYPLNARVWYPEGDGPFPLVLMVHGNHNMTEYSDPGYEYLGRLLASRGFILTSVDQNFLNGTWFGDYQQSEVFTRAWLLLKHLENWRKWNETEENPFFKKVDMDNIALIGHSRGGAAAIIASGLNKLKRYHIDANQEFDFNFSIKGVVQIAPNDPWYPQKDIPIKPENIDYLLMQGSYDQDVFSFEGNKVFNRVHFSDSAYHFKAAIYIHRANHGQFNTVWGRKDLGIPLAWLLNIKPIMDGEMQREIGKIYLSAFLEASLKGKKEFIPLFRDYRNGRNILPKNFYINQFEDSEFNYIAHFNEDYDVTTTSVVGGKTEGVNLKVWSENALPLRDKNSSAQTVGVFLGWDQTDTTYNEPPRYTIFLPEKGFQKFETDSLSHLFFFICNNKNDVDTVNFSIELVTGETYIRKEFNSFMLLPPPLKTKLTKWNFIYAQAKDKPAERVLQFVEIPFSAFAGENVTFHLTEIEQISFVFDQTDKGEIFLDRIGIY